MQCVGNEHGEQCRQVVPWAQPDPHLTRAQASSSPFSGCDALAVHLILMNVACSLSFGSGWRLTASCLCVMVPWVLAHWEEYHTGELPAAASRAPGALESAVRPLSPARLPTARVWKEGCGGLCLPPICSGTTFQSAVRFVAGDSAAVRACLRKAAAEPAPTALCAALPQAKWCMAMA